MIVDVNAYVGRWRYWLNKYMAEDDLIVGLMDRKGVDHAVITHTKCLETDVRAGNDEAAALAARYPGRFSWFCSVYPFDEEGAVKELERAVAAGACGLRLLPQYQTWSLSNEPMLDAIMAAAERLNVPVAVSVRLFMDWQLPSISQGEIGGFVAKYPRNNVIICGVNYTEFRPVHAILKKNKNAYIETSSLMGRGEVQMLAESVGPERVLMGLALPLLTADCGLVRITKAHIGDPDKRAIMGENARRLLRIRTPKDAVRRR